MSDRYNSPFVLLKQLAIALSVTSLVACGGGGGGGGPVDPNPEPTTSSTVSGTAAKGIVANGVVTIYAVNGGGKGQSLASGMTDAGGNYTLTVPGYSGPVIIEITAGQDTQMVCDLSGGCGNGVPFGGSVSLSDGFTLQAVQEVEANETVSTHVNPLTSMAASLAIKSGVSSETIAISNAQVATLFNISGELTDLAPIDITKPDLLVAASEDQKRLSLLSSALIGVGVESGQSLGESLQNLTADFADNDGQMVQRQSVATDAATLEEIFTEIDDLLDLPIYDDKDLGQVEATFSTDLALAKLAEDNALTAIVIRAPATGTNSEIARAFVSDIRDLGVSLTLDSNEAAGNAFADKLETAAEVMSEDSEVALNELVDAMKALERFSRNADWASLGFSITKFPNTSNRYTVEGSRTQASRVSLVVEFTTEELISESEYSFDADVRVLSGYVEAGNVHLALSESQLAFDYNQIYDFDASRIEAVVGSLSVKLGVVFSQKNVPNPVGFDGEISLFGSDINQTFSFDNPYTLTRDFDDVELLLSGKFSRAGESFGATLSVSADGSNYSFVDKIFTGEVSEETTDSFVDFSFSLSLTTQLTGISDEALVLISGDRTALDNGNVTLVVGFEGKRYTIKGTLLDELINGSIQNQDGVSIQLVEVQAPDGDNYFAGTILVKGEQAGSLAYENFAYLFRYEDGQFESF